MSPVRDVTGIRRGAFLPAAGLAVVTAAGLVLAGCSDDGAGVDEAQGSGAAVSADPGEAAVSSTMSDQAAESSAAGPTDGDAPQPTPAGEPADEPAGDGAPAPAPKATPGGDVAPPNQVAMADYTVPLNGQDSMICMFRDSQETDGFDWGCQAENFHAGWDATRGGDANGVAYRAGGDPALYALLGNAAGINRAGALEDGAVTGVGDRFVVDLTQPDAALITADGVTTRVTADSYEIVG
ncbi:hypothetical protein [Corynebacterium kalidii]|uniref:Uncharacterized protein n=1 Tax=Corynebacterium kalidii TaxID=2931982 RepID=A0A9X2AYV7_9CORY|nr:hypothetical protein [Corynebacterium kalidii]MCJ7858476.1 hypothetical protein [Corynebacterium kalidii]